MQKIEEPHERKLPNLPCYLPFNNGGLISWLLCHVVDAAHSSVGNEDMTHNLTEDELSDYIEEQRRAWRDYASSTSAGNETKRLQFCIGLTSPMYQVLLGKRTIYIGILKETAVREYNALSNGER